MSNKKISAMEENAKKLSAIKEIEKRIGDCIISALEDNGVQIEDSIEVLAEVMAVLVYSYDDGESACKFNEIFNRYINNIKEIDKWNKTN